MRSLRRTSVVLAALIAAHLARGDTLVLTTAHDNTLVEDPQGSWSSGAGQNFYSGRVGTNDNGTKRRGVMQFNVSAIPAGSTIESVTLKLYCSKAGNNGTYPVSLKPLTNSFGEGASRGFGGAGSPSQPGDATWMHRFYPNVLWNTPGGDFSPTVSATKSVAGVGYYTWTSTPQLVADVQSWVNSPVTNFGWLVQGNETTLHSVKRFDTHEVEAAATKPVLTIVYTPPVLGDINGDQKVDATDLAILLGQWGSTGSADVDHNGVVDGADLSIMLGAWTG